MAQILAEVPIRTSPSIMRLPSQMMLKSRTASAERETVSGVNQAGFRLPARRGVEQLWLKTVGVGKLVSMGSEPRKQSSAPGCSLAALPS